MDNTIKYLIVILLAFFVFNLPKKTPEVNLEIDREENVISCVAQNSPQIRLLILKHSREQMADDDATLAINAVKKAAAKGLNIKTIGNYFANRDGKMRVVFYDFDNNAAQFKALVEEEMKVDAVDGDTVILFTIGHGFASGGLDNLGGRPDVLKAIAEAAEANDQRTLWWQLSCHSTANLPNLSTLTAKQQELLTILGTSWSDQTSAAYVQGHIMEKVFVAMADKSPKIDVNQDDQISGTELKNFLNTVDTRKRGDLLFAIDFHNAIFGDSTILAQRIPIFHNNQQLGKEFILIPKRRI